MRYNLIFDGDDTLWENNVLFERAVETFIDHLAHPELSRDQVRQQLNEIEKINVRKRGYGVDSFEHSLGECLALLRDGQPVTDADRAVLTEACAPIRSHAIELIDGVADTLRLLAERHELFLITKGSQAEQTAKIEASGLAAMFSDIAVVPEKEPSVYESFAAEHELVVDQTWMVGNSPRSDIWPALDAGLGAVLVPHPMTWALEMRDLPDGHERFRTVTPFAALREHF